jgi:hypothetical protein
LLFEAEHDDQVYKSYRKYDYSEKYRFPNNVKLPLGRGIVDEQSAKKFLGENLDKYFVLLRNSMTFSGKT